MEEFFDYIGSFCNEYCKINSLTDIEKKNLPIFIDILCIRFIIFFCHENVKQIRDMFMDVKEELNRYSDIIMKQLFI